MGQVVTATDVISVCVCVCVSLICHSSLHSLERGLSQWSLREETQQLMMLVLIQSWEQLYGVKKVPEDPIGIIHHSWGHGTTGFKIVDMKTLKVRSVHHCLVNFHVQNSPHEIQSI